MDKEQSRISISQWKWLTYVHFPVTLDSPCRAIGNKKTHIMSRLPDPASQPSFQIATGGLVPRNNNNFPCEVRDYVIDARNWARDIPVANQRTVRGVLRLRNGVWPRVCFVCEQGPDRCRAGRSNCVQKFLRERQRPEYRRHFESEFSPNMLQCVNVMQAPWTRSMSGNHQSVISSEFPLVGH